VQSNETRVEVGLIGCEGMSGTAVVLGSNRSVHSTYMQVEGEGQRVPTQKLLQAIKESDLLRELVFCP